MYIQTTRDYLPKVYGFQVSQLNSLLVTDYKTHQYSSIRVVAMETKTKLNNNINIKIEINKF